MLPEARVHVGLYRGGILQNVLKNSLLNRPPEEVQLAHGGLLDGRGTGHDETDALTTAERIEQLLAVGLELTLVLEVDDELAFVQHVGYIELLGVVCHEPLDNTKTDGCRTIQKGHDRFDASRLVVELLEPTDNVVLFALNAVLEGVARGLHPCMRRHSGRFKWTQCGVRERRGFWARTVGANGRRRGDRGGDGGIDGGSCWSDYRC